MSESLIAIGTNPAPATAGLLLVSDGTALGTRVVANNFVSAILGVVDGGVVYSGRDSVHGIEPWFADLGATSQAVGQGCGVAAIPSLRADEPRLGQSFSLRAAGLGVSNSVLWSVPAFTPQRVPLPIAGCAWFGEGLLAANTMPGTGELSLRAPSGADLIGVRLMAQLATIDTSAALGLSNGVRLTLGR